MTKRGSVGFIYLGVIICTLLLRIASSLDIYGALNVEDSDAFYSCVVQILIFGVMPLALYALILGRKEGLGNLPKNFGVKAVKPLDCLIVLGLAVCMYIISMAVSYVWQSMLILVGYTHIPSDTDYGSVGALFRELALVAVLPAMFEEITHRGLIYAGYRNCGYKFVLISALLFSLMHQNIVQTGYTFLAGAMMALAMYYTDSIFPSMFMHFFNNAMSVSSGYIEQNGGPFHFFIDMENWLTGTLAGNLVGCFAVIVFIAAAVLLYLALRKRAVKRGIIGGKYFECELDKKPLYKDIPFLITVVIGVGATIFTLVWGIMR